MQCIVYLADVLGCACAHIADKEDAETARLAGLSFVDMEAEAARDLPASDGVVHFDRMHKRILMAEKEYEHDRADREPTKGALALLRGLRVRYLMRTREILIGRDTYVLALIYIYMHVHIHSHAPTQARI